MSRKTDADGVFTRRDRGGYWISWFDAQGRRRYRKTDAETLKHARAARSAELVRVEQAKTLGFAPPSEEEFAGVAERFLKHQKPRLTAKEYERQSGVVEKLLKPFFPGKVKEIRRTDVQRYITERGIKVKPATVSKEATVLKHLLGLAVEWELIPSNPAHGVKSPKAPPGRVRYLQPTELRALVDVCPPLAPADCRPGSFHGYAPL